MDAGDHLADRVKTFWGTRAEQHGTKSSASMPDVFLTEMEIDVLSGHLEDGDRVLDVGCANGFTTLRLASLKAAQFVGVDFSPAMIQQADKGLLECKDSLLGSVSFAVDDILELSQPEGVFNKIICKRVLINLGSVDRQIYALERVHSVLDTGGVLLMSEASKQAWQNLNALRAAFGLGELAEPWHNLYLDEDLVLPQIDHLYELLDIEAFSSTYYLGSRVLQPFVIGPSSEPTYDSEINKLFSQLPAYGDYGYQKLFVLKKR